jgi:hypothetical protein
MVVDRLALTSGAVAVDVSPEPEKSLATDPLALDEPMLPALHAHNHSWLMGVFV